LGLADKLNIMLPLTKAVNAVFETAVSEGKADMDMPAVFTTIAKLKEGMRLM